MDLLRQIPLIMGVLFIAIGVFHGWKLRSVVRRCTVYADGVVAGFHEVKTRSGVMYYPVIEFSVEHKKIRAEYKLLPNGNSRREIRLHFVITRGIPKRFIYIIPYPCGNSIYHRYVSL